ncbi:hypothetical protein BKI52_00015 [marine bacterium AO1-C]|nr:hypothetical protein BKI52_00015 [marine bacterium AO1-C]
MSTRNHWSNYVFEIISVFIGVTLAFGLSKWNENRRDYQSERKILIEIRNGLKLDLKDLTENIYGHRVGIKACRYFRKIILEKPVADDSTSGYYYALLRDYISIQNKSGYEALKSKGLEFISNDSLRVKVIALYDYNYEILEKLEEDYQEIQFNKSYFHRINDILADFMIFDKKGNLKNMKQPLKLSTRNKNLLLSYLLRIETNRRVLEAYYLQVEKKVKELIQELDKTIKP